MNKLKKNIWKNSIYNSLKKKKNTKYLGVNLTKDVNYIYKVKCNPLKKEIKGDY
jgi:hypothetical protein